MNDLKNLISQLIGERTKDSVVTEIANTANSEQLKESKKNLDNKKQRFLKEYENMTNYIYFGGAGILDRAGFNIDQYMSLGLDEKEALNNKYNLLAPNGLNDFLIQGGYNYTSIMKNHNLQEEIIGTDKYFQDATALKRYLTAYGDLATSIKNGYKDLEKAGENLKHKDSFRYVLGALSDQQLEDILAINDSQIDHIVSNLKMYGINIENDDVKFNFNEVVASENLAKILQNNLQSAAIIKGGQAITQEALINSFEALRQMNILDREPEEIERLKVLQEQNNADWVVKNNQDNINLVAGLFKKQQESLESLNNVGNTISLNFDNLQKGLDVLSNPKKLIDDGIEHKVPVFENLNKRYSKDVQETYNRVYRDLNEQAATFVQNQLDKGKK